MAEQIYFSASARQPRSSSVFWQQSTVAVGPGASPLPGTDLNQGARFVVIDTLFRDRTGTTRAPRARS
jgi:hypothetical protein